MRVNITVYLVRNEQEKKKYRSGISPEFFLEKTPDEENFYNAVRQKVGGAEESCVYRDVLKFGCQVDYKPAGNFGFFKTGQKSDYFIQKFGSNKK